MANCLFRFSANLAHLLVEEYGETGFLNDHFIQHLLAFANLFHRCIGVYDLLTGVIDLQEQVSETVNRVNQAVGSQARFSLWILCFAQQNDGLPCFFGCLVLFFAGCFQALSNLCLALAVGIRARTVVL